MKIKKNARAKAVPDLSLDEDLDRSRKQKLWIRANWTATILIAAFFVLAILSFLSDVRGEYGASSESLGGIIICSIVHSDKKISARLLLPRTPLLFCETSEENIGENVDWKFQPVKPGNGLTPVHFRGKIDAYSMSGIIQDGL